MSDHPVTCQVCGRAIKAKNGIIAHHGYKRPGDGWQTASCYGARAVPYEVGHDRLDAAIRDVTAHIANAENRHMDLTHGVNLPKTITRKVRSYNAWAKPTYEDVAMPADFDPTPNNRYSDRPYEVKATEAGKYAAAFDDNLAGLRRDIEASRLTLVFLTNRRAKWVAPATKE